jgi:hypothetical protein
MPGQSSEGVSELLAQWEAGDQAALGALVPRIYSELHRIAHYYLRKQLSLPKIRSHCKSATSRR